MGLFAKAGSKSVLVDMRSSWRGRLSHELWSQDDTREEYRDVAHELLREYAEAGLKTKDKEPLPRHVEGLVLKILPAFAPDYEAAPTLADSARSAYLLASAEAWGELDANEVIRLATDGWDQYRTEHPDPRESHPRFRGGVMLVGLTGNHPFQSPRKRMAAFQPLGQYVMGQNSLIRLADLEGALCTSDIEAFFAFSPDDEARYRWNNVGAWHLGVCAWVLDHAKLLVR